MAEAKAKEKPKHTNSAHSGGGESGGGNNLFLEVLFWVLLGLMVFSMFKGAFSSVGSSFNFPSASSIFEFVFDKVQIYSVFLSLVFFIGIIYFNFKLGELAHASHHRIHGHSHGEHGHAQAHDSRFGAPAQTVHLPKAFANAHSPEKRWEMVQTRLNSFSEGDWRLAIIEADIILNDMLAKMGYEGDSVAERLKRADKSSFDTIDLAWEAHKFRNRVAHEGASFHMTHEEAKHIIARFKQVFDEFYFV